MNDVTSTAKYARSMAAVVATIATLIVLGAPVTLAAHYADSAVTADANDSSSNRHNT